MNGKDVFCRNSVRALYDKPPLEVRGSEGAERVRNLARRVASLMQANGVPHAGIMTVTGFLPCLAKALLDIDPPQAKIDESRLLQVRRALAEYLASPIVGYLARMPSDIAIHMCELELFSHARATAPSLDLGIGGGQISRMLFSRADAKVSVGSDLSANSVSGVKQDCPELYDELQVIDMEAIPYQDGTFSTVFSVHALDHVPNRRKALSEAARVLAPGGDLYLSDTSKFWDELKPFSPLLSLAGAETMHGSWLEWALERHGARDTDYSLEEYVAIVEGLGLEVVHATYFLSPRLMTTAYLFFDLQILFGGFGQLDLSGKDPAAAALFKMLLDDVIAPLVAVDPAACRIAGKGGSLFIHARRAGGRTSDAGPLHTRLMCPIRRTPLHLRDGWYRGPNGEALYPVLPNGVPLFTEAHADEFRAIHGLPARSA
jgi:SAM-dependent methyltransferase